jgi:hypothetical protein
MHDIILTNISELNAMSETQINKLEKLNALSKTERLKNNAQLSTSPSGNATAVIKSFCNTFGEQDSQAIFSTLATSLKKSLDGDSKTIETMLIAQAHSLQSIFSMLAQQATAQKSTSKMETYLRLALKAQTQCRTTLEAVSNLKKPSAIYANQANISHGHQQVNNSAESDIMAPVVEK